MRSILLAGAALIALALPASASEIITFAQTGGANTLTATVNAAHTVTTLADTNSTIAIGQFLGGSAPTSALFDFNATSTGAATTVAGNVIQRYSGSFCITTAANCGGTNILSGKFTDAAFGELGGPGLTMNANDPPDLLTLTSSLLPASALALPDAASLAFTNLTPSLAILGTTLAPFAASVAGDVSANAVPEPATIALLGIGLIGLGIAYRRNSTTTV